ncbi:MAG: FecR domain-containing protein [Chthoniobacteraceae bacterium]
MATERDRLEFLLNRYFDQGLSAPEKQELELALLASPGARETFWQLSHWHGAIRQWAEEEAGRREVVEDMPAIKIAHPQPRPRYAPAAASRRSRAVRRSTGNSGWWWSLAAAAMLVLGFFVWKPRPVQAPARLAVLAHAASVVWAEHATAYHEGEPLPGGTLELKSGALEIEFARGARVVLEGPAEFELLSANSGALRRGKLVATVPPPAHGFMVQTPGFSVTDYGTQFGCNVSQSAPAEVHVFQGTVGVETAGPYFDQAARGPGGADRRRAVAGDSRRPECLSHRGEAGPLPGGTGSGRLAAIQPGDQSAPGHAGLL